MTLASIREKRAAKVAEARSILAKAETDKRQLTADETKTFDAIKAEITNLEADEARAQFMADAERRMQGEPVKGAGDTLTNLEARVNLADVIRAGMEGRAVAGAAAEFHAEAERRSGRKAQGVLVPFSVMENRASPNTTTTAAQIVPTDYRPGEYITPFRNKLLARALGVRVLSGLHGDVSIPKHGSGTTNGWVAEGSSLSTTDMSFASIGLAPKHAGAISEISRQLIQQSSPDVEQLLRDDMAAGIAQAIDSAIIVGGGTNQPKGILSTTGISTASLATLSWDGILGMLEAADLDNAAPAAWLTSPKVARKLRGTLKSASAGAAYLLDGGRMADLPVSVTNQVPVIGDDGDKGQLILGDFTQAILGIWSELDILVNPYDSTAYARGGVLVRAMATVDVAVRHPEAFVVAADVAV